MARADTNTSPSYLHPNSGIRLAGLDSNLSATDIHANTGFTIPASQQDDSTRNIDTSARQQRQFIFSIVILINPDSVTSGSPI